ncbi:MAG: glutamate--tRNA ligase family protein, partial [Bdellovibrionales bacterium]|nr:glutamate--tRNA ligase family protein [Bdellovibrionales bacterium]
MIASNKPHGSGVRFAPSPTGRFHVGNLRTAWVANALAKALHEPLVLRVEDIDTARAQKDSWFDPENGQAIDLKRIGIEHDADYEWSIRQSTRYERHLEFFNKARSEGRIYPCDCSRKDVLRDLEQFATAPHSGTPSEYSGRCRNRDSSSLADYKPADTLAWRWRMPESDTLPGQGGRHDPIVARTRPGGEGFAPGYNFACAIDDAEGDFHVLVRAWDLEPVENVQALIRNWVNARDRAVVFHCALITRDDGGRLEKRTQGVTLSELLSLGVNVDLLTKKFAASFDQQAALQQ